MLTVDGEHLLVRIDHDFGVRSRPVAMNDTAAIYWEMLEENLDTRDMLVRMKELCNSEQAVSEDSLNRFLTSLEAVGVILKTYKK